MQTVKGKKGYRIIPKQHPRSEHAMKQQYKFNASTTEPYVPRTPEQHLKDNERRHKIHNRNEWARKKRKLLKGRGFSTKGAMFPTHFSRWLKQQQAKTPEKKKVGFWKKLWRGL